MPLPADGASIALEPKLPLPPEPAPPPPPAPLVAVLTPPLPPLWAGLERLAAVLPPALAPEGGVGRSPPPPAPPKFEKVLGDPTPPSLPPAVPPLLPPPPPPEPAVEPVAAAKPPAPPP